MLYLGLLIQALFYISASSTGWLNIFFSGPALHHCCHGMDFYQVPNGAWSALHNGSFTGYGAKYYTKNFVNPNVYHPLFTFLIGSFLIRFDAGQAFYVWMWVKAAFTLATIAYFYWTFRESKFAQLATFILLANFAQYLEIAVSQYHALFNCLLLLLMINLVKCRHQIAKGTLMSGILYFLTLLVKPIGLLFAPAFFVKKRKLILLFALINFAFVTLIYWKAGPGAYYVDNLWKNLSNPNQIGPSQIVTLNALLRHTFNWPDLVYKSIQYVVLAFILLLSSLQRIPVQKAIFLSIVYFLFFYNLVYEYDWSSLAIVIAVCLVTLPEFQTRLTRVFALLTCLPSALFVLNWIHFDVKAAHGIDPGNHAWQIMVLSRLIPAFLLCITVLAADMKPAFVQLKTFWIVLQRANRYMRVFGEQEDIELSPSILAREQKPTREVAIEA